MTSVDASSPIPASALIRHLSLCAGASASPAPEFAARLGSFLGFQEALTLSAAQAVSSPGTEHEAISVAWVEAEIQRVEDRLTRSIQASFRAGEVPARLPLPVIDPVADAATAFEPLVRFYLAHQRDMELVIKQSRSRLRDAIAPASSRLCRLVAIDNALDEGLSLHARRIFSRIPRLLEIRFRREWDAHAAVSDHSQRSLWLSAFYRDLESVLLAELQTRLQPLRGLARAVHEEVM